MLKVPAYSVDELDACVTTGAGATSADDAYQLASLCLSHIESACLGYEEYRVVAAISTAVTARIIVAKSVNTVGHSADVTAALGPD